MICNICGNTGELRESTCWDCATAESIIHEGTDMYDKGPAGDSNGAETAMDKLKYLIKKGWVIKNKA